MKRLIITPQKEKLIHQDIEKYLMGQTQMAKIAKKRKVPYGVVDRILTKIIYQRIGDNYIPNHNEY